MSSAVIGPAHIYLLLVPIDLNYHVMNILIGQRAEQSGLLYLINRKLSACSDGLESRFSAL